MTENPYAFEPPELPKNTAQNTAQDAEVGPPASVLPLHPLSGVLAATLLGSGIGGAVVIALSLSRLGRKSTAWWTLGLTVAVLFPLFVGLAYLPDDMNVPSIPISVVQMFCTYQIGKQLYGRDLKQQEATGGPIASAWKGAGIGLLSCVVFVCSIVGYIMVAEGESLATLFGDYGNVIVIGQDEIYYDGNAKEADARELGTFLTEAGFLGDSGVSVRISRNSEQCTVSFVLEDDAWDEPEVIEYFKMLASDLAYEGFGTEVIVELCDDTFEPHRSVVGKKDHDVESVFAEDAI